MTYEQIIKMNPGYMVPEKIHNEHFETFKKKFNGFVENHAGRWPTENWRAFEIAFNGGQIGRVRRKDGGADKKETESTDKKRFNRGSQPSSD